ncbi:MAG: SIMPL domain-containing protein [Chloroflexota bacterium]
MRTKIYFVLSVLLLSSLLTACAGAAFAQSATPGVEGQGSQQVYRTLSVNGSGKVDLTPDMAYVSIGVHNEEASATAAVTNNNTQTQKVIDALKSFGIADKDLQTINFSIYPQQKYDQEGKPTGEITYSVDNSVYVTVRDLGKLGGVLDAAVKAGANTINGIQFDVADKQAALVQARKAAIQNAQATAEELAAAAGVSLGAIQMINVYGGDVPVPMYDKRAAGVMTAEAAVPIQPGQVTISVEANLVYEIR